MNEQFEGVRKNNQVYEIKVNKGEMFEKGYVNWPLGLAKGRPITHLPTGLSVCWLTGKARNFTEGKTFVDFVIDEIGVNGLINIETDKKARSKLLEIYSDWGTS